MFKLSYLTCKLKATREHDPIAIFALSVEVIVPGQKLCEVKSILNQTSEGCLIMGLEEPLAVSLKSRGIRVIGKYTEVRWPISKESMALHWTGKVMVSGEISRGKSRKDRYCVLHQKIQK